MSGLLVFLLGVVIGIMLTKITKNVRMKIREYIQRKKVDYFLDHQINYYKPIKKGSYPKEEDV